MKQDGTRYMYGTNLSPEKRVALLFPLYTVGRYAKLTPTYKKPPRICLRHRRLLTVKGDYSN